MKKNNDDKFFIKWKPIHEKGYLLYVVSSTALYFIIIMIFMLFYTKNFLDYMRSFSNICALILILLLYIAGQIWIWSRQEKKYKKIEKANKEIIHR